MIDQAVILAAGRGTRLGDSHRGPKCLLPIGGATLLDRYIGTLDEQGCTVTVVTGFEAPAVVARVDAIAPAHGARTLFNERFELGSIVSLSVALAHVEGPLLLLDGDVLFHPELLRRIAGSTHENALLVDVGSVFTTEEYMAGLSDGRVTTLRRGPVPEAECGEWVGFARLGAAAVRVLRVAIESQIARGEVAGGYEDALASLLAHFDVRCEPTEGLPWVEIDFPADVERAQLLLPALEDA